MNTPGTSMSRLSAPPVACDAHARHAGVVAQHFVHRVIPDDIDHAGALPFEQVILQDLFGAQLVAPMNQRDVRGDVREIQRFFDRRVAAADDRDALAPEEEPVARGAGRDAAALKCLLGRQAQVAARSRPSR